MKILAIETSHDDSSISLVDGTEILKEVTISQTDYHKKFGGTIPEYASRMHVTNIQKAFQEFADFDLTSIDHIAYTNEPGLIGSLQMGRLFALGLGFALDKKVFPINHMHAHIFAAAFEHEIIYPSLALIVSGGHTQIWNVKSVNEIELISQTSDDAAGEVFDKVARVLGLGFPGGPRIDEASIRSDKPHEFVLNSSKDLNLSFSGLKTKVINFVHNNKQKNNEINTDDIAAGFQNTIINYLINKFTIAIEQYNPKSIILGGGVAANNLLRKRFSILHNKALIPSKKFTGDNASMIAIMSYLLRKNNL